MNKSNFTGLIADKLGVPKKEAATYVNAVFDTLTETILHGEHVHISRFGKFMVKPVAPRKARNIHTGEPISLPASRRFIFAPSLTLKKSINKAK